MGIDTLDKPMPPVPHDAFDFTRVFDWDPFFKTENLYLNREPEIVEGLPTVFIFVGPSGGGKDTLRDYLELEGIGARVLTFTSRSRGKDEDENRFQWGRQITAEETQEQYYENLIAEYDLVEYDVHHNALYGLPRNNLWEVLRNSPDRVPIIISEPNGVRTLREKLKGQVNLIVIATLPDSHSDIWGRILLRGREVGDAAVSRFVESIEMIRKYPDTVDFYLHNKRKILEDGTPDLTTSIDAIRQILFVYRGETV